MASSGQGMSVYYSAGGTHAIVGDSDHAARTTGRVLDIFRRLDTIGGLIPEKPLIRLQQQNVVVADVTFADLLREAMDGAGE